MSKEQIEQLTIDLQSVEQNLEAVSQAVTIGQELQVKHIGDSDNNLQNYIDNNEKTIEKLESNKLNKESSIPQTIRGDVIFENNVDLNEVFISNLPLEDPLVKNQLYKGNDGILRISSGHQSSDGNYDRDVNILKKFLETVQTEYSEKMGSFEFFTSLGDTARKTIEKNTFYYKKQYSQNILSNINNIYEFELEMPDNDFIGWNSENKATEIIIQIYNNNHVNISFTRLTEQTKDNKKRLYFYRVFGSFLGIENNKYAKFSLLDIVHAVDNNIFYIDRDNGNYNITNGQAIISLDISE